MAGVLARECGGLRRPRSVLWGGLKAPSKETRLTWWCCV